MTYQKSAANNQKKMTTMFYKSFLKSVACFLLLSPALANAYDAEANPANDLGYREPHRKRNFSTKNYRGCDEKCCSRMRLAGPVAVWGSLTN